MKKYVTIFGLLLFAASIHAQTFRGFVDKLNGMPESGRQALADSFMKALPSIPYRESDTLVHFIFQGPANQIKIAGDATFWKPKPDLVHIKGTNYWYHTAIYPSDARLDYQFVLNGNSWMLDPKNPDTCTGGFGPNSELRMPGYQVPPEISYYPDIPHGTVTEFQLTSKALGDTRTIKVYLPADYYEGNHVYPVILFHDGLDYIVHGKAIPILDFLIAKHMILPVIGIFVSPVDRSAEYADNKMEPFTRFIVDELMPVVKQRYRISDDPRQHAMVGASDGGNISLYIGMKHPEIFGKIAAQSSNVIDVISSDLKNDKKAEIEFYFDIGKYDIPELIPLARKLKNVLERKGYRYHFFQWNEGHSWGNWSGHLRLPLMQFFPFIPNEPSERK